MIDSVLLLNHFDDDAENSRPSTAICNRIPSHGYYYGSKFTGKYRYKEAEMLRILDHPCIAKLFDVFEDDIFVYIVRSILFLFNIPLK